MKNPPERFRILEGTFKSNPEDGCNGMFIVPHPRPKFSGHCLLCMISDGAGWEHVSVSHFSTKKGTMEIMPTWSDMTYVKNLFWGEDETVMQIHPPISEYINNHPYCLHLWKPVGMEIPMPDSMMVGIKGLKL